MSYIPIRCSEIERRNDDRNRGRICCGPARSMDRSKQEYAAVSFALLARINRELLDQMYGQEDTIR